MIEMRWEILKHLQVQFPAFGTDHFFDSLISTALAQNTKEDKWRKHALECFEKAKKQAYTSPHRLWMLEIEMDILMGETNNVGTNYDKAIHAASESEHIHEEAIANERAGDFFLSQGDVRASCYYAEAHKLYLQWGVKGKAALLKRNCPTTNLF
mmetsp:Transcript_37472/g.56082  ORF Transcript_37472/g.56082 Transcript_37472/m.56082 type:complete len:154 (-) Transcript_37472:153-614(-)